MRERSTIRAALVALCAVAFVCAASAGARAEADAPMTMVELFTSQGCSSCPPADAYLGELARRGDVIALSIHVDYWDYIGWKDPFAKSEYSERQRRYQQRFGLRYVYTPQMVIDGAFEAVGSRSGEVDRRIAEAQTRARLPVSIVRKGGALEVRIGGAGPGIPGDPADVWLAGFDRRHETRIARGENGGRTLVNVNVLRRLERIGAWSGAPLALMAAPPGQESPGGDGCVVFVQSGRTGHILGAAELGARH